MSVAMLSRHVDDWRTPGCGVRCQVFPVRFSGRDYFESVVLHDPGHHEAHGRLSGGAVYLPRLPVDGRVVHTGGLEIDGTTCTVRLHGQSLYMPARELALLCFFAERLGRVCPHQEALATVWGAEFVPEPGRVFKKGRRDERTVLRIAVSRLRERLGSERRLLVLHPTVGYQLLAEPPVEARP